MNSPGAHQQEVVRADVALADPLDPGRAAAHGALGSVDAADPRSVPAAGPGPVTSAEQPTIQVTQPTQEQPKQAQPAQEQPTSASTYPASTHEDREVKSDPGEVDAIPARDVITLPAPLVLVGNPRLGSNPAGLPRVLSATPDSVLDGARLANLTVRAASLRGDDHRHAGETRQDSIGLWVFDPPSWLGADVPVLLACVADGVGSQRLSHLGSAKACSLLRQSVEANLNDLVGTDRGHTERNCRQVIRDVATGLRALADERDLAPKQVSTTLMACLVVTERKSDVGAVARAVLFSVGDSPGYLLRERRWLPIPDHAEGEGDGMIDTHTDALPIARLDRTQVTMCTLCEDDMLMLCTDGLGGPLKRNVEVREQLADWWTGTVPALPEFYWQMSFRAQTYGDDRSAVCIWLHGDS